MQQNTQRYSASFTAGGLLKRETDVLLPSILEGIDNQDFSNEIKQNQFLQINAESALKRVLEEVKKRLKNTHRADAHIEFDLDDG